MSFLFGKRRSSTSAAQQRAGSSSSSQQTTPDRPRPGFGASSSPAIPPDDIQPPPAAHTTSRRATSTSSNAISQLRSHVRDESTSSAGVASDSSRGRSRGGFGSASAPAGPGYTTTTPGYSPNNISARANTPPAYAHHSLDRSPLPNPMVLDDRPRVPPPIYLRSSSNQPQSKLGTLTIHVPGWGIALVRPPRQYDLHPLEAGGAQREPPAEDTVLSGILEINMKERRRVQAISVGVQSVTRLNFGGVRGWEEDGIFERGVEVLTGDEEEGIWLEKGSQSFSFSILLPATLATHDYHTHGRVSYIITARVQGVPASTRLGGLFKTKDIPLQGEIYFLADFQAVIARSDKLAAEQAQSMSRSGSRDREGSPSSPVANALGGIALGTPPLSPQDEVAYALNDSTVPTRGLYHRRLSTDMNSADVPGDFQSRPSPLRKDTDSSSIMSRSSSLDGSSRAEKAGWLLGDICCIRSFKVHANPAPSGGAYQLDLRKEGYVDGLGPWRLSASSDAFSIASVMLVKVAIPAPSPACTIFFVRLILSQSYEMYSPRRPNDPPLKPEAPKNHVVYQVGRPHKHGEDVLGHEVEALWRGKEAGGNPKSGPAAGWRTRAVARLPNHEKIRPSTNAGTITPIRVQHEFLLRIFYSIEGETVTGKPLKTPSGAPRRNGAGEVRMCQVRLPVIVPSCLCSTATLNLPTYECAKDDCERENELDPLKQCQCATSFAELSASALKKTNEQDDDLWGTGMSEGMPRTESERGKQREARVQS